MVAGEANSLLYAATSERDTDWVFRLCDVNGGGVSINIAETVQRARYRNGPEREQLIDPGEIEAFRLSTTCFHLFKTGHHIRIHVTSSSFPMWDRNLNMGGAIGHEPLSARKVAIQSILHDQHHPSQVILPVVG